MAGRVVVYGGKGALGSAIVSFFRQKQWWVASVDHLPNEEADANVVVQPCDAWASQHERVLEGVDKVLQDGKIDALICVAGGWAGGNAASVDYVKNCDSLWKSSVWTSVIASSLASKYLKEGGLLALTGAKAALEPTPGMIGYGMAKAAVHHLVQSLAGAKSGLPQGATVVAILPVTLDTPMNRKFMPKADFSSWTPLSFVAELFFKWTAGQERPANGSLVKLVTEGGRTSVQILKLAATKEEMEREMRVKRVHVPPIRMSEVDNVTECGVPAAARKKSLKQQEKAKQQNQITSKKQQYEDVLKRHVSHSLQKNAAIPGHSSIGRKASKKRKPQILDDSTESEDESVVSSRELKNAVKEAKYWKQRYRLEQEHTASLKRELDFLKRKVELQLSSYLCADALPVVAPSILPNGAVEASRRDPTAARGAATEQAAAAEKDVGGAASVVPTPAGPSEEAPASSCFTADAPRSAELEASVLDDAQDFTLTSGGLAPMDVAESQETLAGPSQQEPMDVTESQETLAGPSQQEPMDVTESQETLAGPSQQEPMDVTESQETLAGPSQQEPMDVTESQETLAGPSQQEPMDVTESQETLAGPSQQEPMDVTESQETLAGPSQQEPMDVTESQETLAGPSQQAPMDVTESQETLPGPSQQASMDVATMLDIQPGPSQAFQLTSELPTLPTAPVSVGTPRIRRPAMVNGPVKCAYF
ncbi:uncharacterized protein LOC144112551 isoform X3 [Amblyomma americanum]